MHFKKILTIRIPTKHFSIKCTGSNPIYLHRIENKLVNLTLEIDACKEEECCGSNPPCKGKTFLPLEREEKHRAAAERRGSTGVLQAAQASDLYGYPHGLQAPKAPAGLLALNRDLKAFFFNGGTGWRLSPT